MGRTPKVELENSDLFTFQADEVSEVISSLPGKEQKIKLFRINPQGNNAYVTEFYPETFSLEWIKETYGGGKYNIVADTNDGPKKMRFEMEGEPRIQGATRVVERQMNGKVYLVNVAEKDLVLQGIKAMQTQDAPPSPSPAFNSPDPSIALLSGLINRLETRLDSLQNANHAPNRKEFYEELALMKEMFAPQASPSNVAATEIAALIKTGLELGAKAANGDVAGPSIWESIAEKALPMIGQVLTQIQNRSSLPAPAPAPSPSVNPKLPVNGFADMLPGMPAEQPKPMVNGPAFIGRIQPYIGFLIGAAATGNDPGPWAEIIINQLGSNDWEPAKEWLSGNQWIQDLIGMDQRITLQQSWFVDLRDAILETMKQAEESQEQDNGENVQ